MDIKPRNPKQNRKDWLDWLSDDLPTQKVREELRSFRVKQANTYKSRVQQPIHNAAKTVNLARSDGKTLVINLSMPKFKVPKLNFIKAGTNGYQLDLQINDTRNLIIGAGVVLLLVTGVSHLFSQDSTVTETSKPIVSSSVVPGTATVSSQSTSVLGESKTAQPSTASKNSSSSSSSSKLKPSFLPAVPSNKPELANSIPVRTAYDSSRGVYTFMDTFKGAPLTVNEQSLSGESASYQSSVKQNADKFGATQALTLAGGTAYVGVDKDTKFQIIVFSVRNVLVVVNSIAQHNASDWTPYLNSFY
jgi:hypothetical protein